MMVATKARKLAARPYSRVVTKGDDGMFLASIVEMPNVFTDGETESEALADLDDLLPVMIEVMLDRGIPIPEPIEPGKYSGRLQLRMPPSLHRRAAIRAHVEGVSLNRMLSDAVAMYVGMPVTSAAPAEPAPPSKPRATRQPATRAKPAKATPSRAK